MVYSLSNSFLNGQSIHCANQSGIDFSPRPALIKHFIVHSYHCEDTVVVHLFAFVSWLKEHHARFSYVKPFEIWWSDLYDSDLSNLVPIQLFLCHAVHCNIDYEAQTVYLMCPVQNIPYYNYY